MKHFLILALMAGLAFPVNVIAQQTTITANAGDVSCKSLNIVANNYFVVGNVTKTLPSHDTCAFIGRYNDFSALGGKAIIDSVAGSLVNSQLYRQFEAPNNDIIVVGKYQGNGLIARFDQNGNQQWVTILELGQAIDEAEVFEGVTILPSGNIVVVGTQSSFSGSHELYALLSSGGIIIEVRRGPVRPAGNKSKAVQVFYMDEGMGSGMLYVVGQTTYTPPSTNVLSNTTTTVTHIDPATFDVVGYQLIGTNEHEYVLDAQATSDGILILLKLANDNSSRVIIWFKGWDVLTALQLSGGPFSPSFDTGGTLRISGSSVYVAGGANGSSGQRSYLMRVNMNTFPNGNYSLTPAWGKLVTPGTSSNCSYGTAIAVNAGEVTMADAHSGIKSTITSLTLAGGPTGSYCNIPVAFTPSWLPYGMNSADMEIALPLINDYSQGTTIFRPYQTNPAPCDVMLPVELLEFSGEQVGNAVDLQWTTGSESTTDHFNVTRSADGINFEEIGTVAAHGAAGMEMSYEFVDASPEQGANYYRLEVVEDHGGHGNSDIVYVAFIGDSNEETMKLFPNPARAGTEISVNKAFMAISVYDVMSREVPSSTLGNKLYIEARAGEYLARVTTIDGGVETVRVVIE